MRTTSLKAVSFAVAFTLAIALLLTPAKIWHHRVFGQVPYLPDVQNKRVCQPIPPSDGLGCISCGPDTTNPSSACQYSMPAGFVHGVCNACSGCGDNVCLIYTTFNCGRKQDCHNGDFIPFFDCDNFTDISFCK